MFSSITWRSRSFVQPVVVEVVPARARRDGEGAEEAPLVDVLLVDEQVLVAVAGAVGLQGQDRPQLGVERIEDRLLLPVEALRRQGGRAEEVRALVVELGQRRVLVDAVELVGRRRRTARGAGGELVLDQLVLLVAHARRDVG
jgi:hypothetical protein